MRDDLAALWLPWCVAREVAREDWTQIIRIDEHPMRRDIAIQLRVGDLDDERARAALSRQVVREDGRTSLDLVIERADAYAAAAKDGHDVTIPLAGTLDDPAVFVMSEGPMLHEACHRACALYEAQVHSFELQLPVDALFGPWSVYEHATLRVRPPAS